MTGTAAPPRRILVAEDDTVSRSFLVAALQELPGSAIDACAGGGEALRAACTQAFDLLVLDVGLPDLPGAAVLSALRGDPQAASREAPALALSAGLDDAGARALRLAGFDAAQAKPLSALQLRALAADLLGLLVWDDAAASRALAGNDGAVAGLRSLLRGDLPEQLATIRAALAAGEPSAARAVLHRLTAACGFCGAVELAGAVEALALRLAEGGSHERALVRFEGAAARILAPTG